MCSVSLTFKVSLPPEHARIVYNSLTPEARSMRRGRSSVDLTTEADGVVFNLSAADFIAARAAANTLIRLLNTSIATIEVLKDVS